MAKVKISEFPSASDLVGAGLAGIQGGITKRFASSLFAGATHTHLEADITDLQSYEPSFSKNTAFNVDFGNLAGQACEGNDARLSDDRNPTAHTHTESEITDLGNYEIAFSKNTGFNLNLGSGAGTVCEGNDARLSDARTPLSHTHTESEITDLGTYEPAFSKNTAFNKNFGSASDTVCQGNDARLSDDRNPTAHTHTEAEITDLGNYADATHTHTESDITDLGAYLTDAPSDGNEYVRKNAAWSVATGGGGGGLTEYMVPIWAEENSGLGNNTYEWAFGNGANTPSNAGITIYVPTGFECHIVAMTGTTNNGSGSSVIEANINGTLQGANCNVTLSGRSGVNDSFTPVALSSGDRLTFRTTTAGTNSGPSTVTAWLRYRAV